MSKAKKDVVWEDREVLFDLPFEYLKLRSGEKVFDRIEPMEDTKGNSGMKGRLVVTNLRIIWHSLSSPRINLCLLLDHAHFLKAPVPPQYTYTDLHFTIVSIG